MGIYSNTRLNSVGTVDVDVPANENYNHVTGCAMALVETYQNDMAIFEGVIYGDMAEVAAMNEGTEVINEGVKEVWGKLVEFFKKLLEKIKGIFKSFMARISGVFRDSEKLYEKYNKVIAKNTNWKNFKAKWRKAKENNVVELISKSATFNFHDYDIASDLKTPTANMQGLFTFNDIYDPDKTIDEDDIETAVLRSLNDALSKAVSKPDEINKELMDIVFEDEETKDDWNTGDILHSCIGDLLKEADKNLRNIEKYNKNMEDSIAKVVSKISKEQDKIIKVASNVRLGKTDTYASGTKVTGTAGEDANKGKAKFGANTVTGNGIAYSSQSSLDRIERLINFDMRYATKEQVVVNKLTAARMACYKYALAQARRIWSSAAAYASVDHKNESYDYYTAVGEAVEHDTLTDLQAIIA